MKILKVLLYIALGLAGLLVVFGLFAKKDYHIERSLEMDAPKDLVYNYVRYFKNGPSWSPWAKLDPNMKESIEGPDGEVGAVHKWSGNDDVGEGQQTIKAMTPDRIDIEVKFLRPFESTSPTYMTFRENGKKTTVTWAFDMHVAFPWNGMAMFTDIDAGIGGDYERGLKNLQRECEALAHKKYNGYEVAEAELPLQHYVALRKTVPIPEIGAFYVGSIPKVIKAVQKLGASMTGAPSTLFWSYDEAAGKADMAAAVPIGTDGAFGPDLSVVPVGGSRALLVEYFGAYEKTGEAHMAMDAYMAEKGLEMVPPVVEEYVTDPKQEPDTAKWLTKVIYFVKPKTADAPTTN